MADLESDGRVGGCGLWHGVPLPAGPGKAPAIDLTVAREGSRYWVPGVWARGRERAAGRPQKAVGKTGLKGRVRLGSVAVAGVLAVSLCGSLPPAGSVLAGSGLPWPQWWPAAPESHSQAAK